MKRMIHIGFCILLLIIQFNKTLSQSITFRHISGEDGLSQNTVNCIFQDSDGFLWFGTQDGLNFFDGYTFKILRNNPSDKNSISHNWIWDVFEDSRKDIWIATWNGLSLYQPETNTFSHFLPDSASENGIRGSRPASLCEDVDGYLWVGTWGGGLNRYDPVTENFFCYSSITSGDTTFPGDFVREVFYDSKQRLWIGTWEGLWLMEKDSAGKYYFQHFLCKSGDYESISNNRITAIAEDKKGRIWIGTLGGGVNLLHEKAQRFERFLHLPGIENSLPGNDVSSILCDRLGDLWIGTISDGVSRFNPDLNKYTNHHNVLDDINSLRANDVTCIYEDRSGQVWIGAGGLNIYNPWLLRFNQYSCFPLMREFRNVEITSFYEDEAGNIWIGTETKGLICYSTTICSLTTYMHDHSNPYSLSNNNIGFISGDRQGNIWIATRGGGLNQLNPQTGKFVHFYENPENPATAGLNYLNGICYDDAGYLWIATYDKGMIRFDLKTHSFKNYLNNPADPASLPGNYLFRIYSDSRDDLWVCTWGKGLARFNKNKEIFEGFSHVPDDPNSLRADIVHAVQETLTDSGRILWVCNNSGLSYTNLSDPAGIRFRHLCESDGIAGSTVYGVLDDKSGNLWLSTTHGISRYNMRTGTVRNYNSKDGLQSNEFNAGAFLKLGNGMFIFGGINGFNLFYPDSIMDRAFNPEIRLTSFRVFNEELFMDKSLNFQKEIRLSYKQNFFSFGFTSLDYTEPANNRYRYKMEGVDMDWIEAGDRRYASYTRIDPGTYTFRVRGTNSDGFWGSGEASVKVIIIPPFWMTWWFRGVTMFFILLIFYFLHRYQLNKVREMEKLRVRIASDLHDDIGAALTRINIHSQQLQSSRDWDRVEASSRKIGELSREIISSISDVIWSIDARNDTLNDLQLRMREFSYNALSTKDINVIFRQEGMMKNKKIPVNCRQNIFYIFKEAINNIVKYSESTEVTIQLSNTDKEFRMSISDNGKGFDPSSVREGNGLRNMRMRAGRIGGQIVIENSGGTHILFRMKNL